jgi:hypothetical protein
LGKFITGIGSLSPLLGVKNVHLVDRSDLLKIGNLVYDGKEILRRYIAAYRDRHFMAGIVS